MTVEANDAAAAMGSAGLAALEDLQSAAVGAAPRMTAAARELDRHETNTTCSGCVCGWLSESSTYQEYLNHAASAVFSAGLQAAGLST